MKLTVSYTDESERRYETCIEGFDVKKICNCDCFADVAILMLKGLVRDLETERGLRQSEQEERK